MTTLRETIEVALPARDVEDRLLRYFENRRGADGAIVLPLRVALHNFGLPGDLNVEHPVRVMVRQQRDQENLNNEIAIAWKPDRDGSYPAFEGRLIVWSEDNPGRSFIELRGAYEPPLGATGLVFDAALGNAIARSTAQRLLEDLRDSLERHTQDAHSGK